MTIPTPKVFISHASKDKDRFVRGFAERLRANWVDEWEMGPSDSLVQRIFEGGIAEAQTFVVVLSHNSVNSNWVRAELDAGIVQRIEHATKLLPIVIDDCTIPVSLQGILWQKISKTTSYDEEFDRILAAIFEYDRKPPLGPPPKYVQLAHKVISTLTPTDSLVLKTICEVSLEVGQRFVQRSQIMETLTVLDISEDQCLESLEILAGRYFIQDGMKLQGGIFSFTVTSFGFREYASVYLPEFDQLVHSALVTIANAEGPHRPANNKALAEELDQPEIMITYALVALEDQQYVKLLRTAQNHIRATTTVLGKRAANEG